MAMNRIGFGGGICLIFIDSSASFTISRIGFSQNDGIIGKDLFIESTDLETNNTTGSIKFFLASSPFSEESCVGVDKKWMNVMIPLLFFLKEQETAVSVFNDGNDVNESGFIDYPCKTVAVGLTLQIEQKDIVDSDWNGMERMFGSV